MYAVSTVCKLSIHLMLRKRDYHHLFQTVTLTSVQYTVYVRRTLYLVNQSTIVSIISNKTLHSWRTFCYCCVIILCMFQSSVPPSSPPQTGSPPPSAASPPPGRCCDTGRPLFTDPLTGQTVCSCQYDLLSYQRLAGASSLPALSVYSAPYPEGMAAYFPALGADQPAFYTSAVSTFISSVFMSSSRSAAPLLTLHHCTYTYKNNSFPYLLLISDCSVPVKSGQQTTHLYDCSCNFSS